jgi:hypothetical protein
MAHPSANNLLGYSDTTEPEWAEKKRRAISLGFKLTIH